MVYAPDDLESLLGRFSESGCRITHTFKAQPDGRLWSLIFEATAESVAKVVRLPETMWIGVAPGPPELGGEMSSSVNSGDIGPGGPLLDYRGRLGDFAVDGSGVTWAVIDSGVDRQHPDLVISEGINGPDCETPTPGDDISSMKHGTPVAGLLSGTAATGRADSDGFLYSLGVAPGAHLVVHNGLCGVGPWPPVDGWQSLTESVLAAGAIGANNSWFSGTSDRQGYDTSARAMDILVRDGDFATDRTAEQFTLVFAAGNSGPGAMTLRPPNHAKNIITVGAIENWRSAGNAETMADFSSRGPTDDGRIVPTVVAPGEAVTTTVHRDLGIIGDLWEIEGTDGLYTMFEGTSAAAPHVSGSLAVITEWWRKNHGGRNPSPAMSKALLVNAAVDLDDEEPVPNFSEGWGRVDLGRVLEPGVAMMYLDQARVLRETGDSWQVELEVDDPSTPLKITLAWTDAPAAPEVNPALVNDLDLEMETGGREFHGNVFAHGWSVEGGNRDAVNNLENIFVTAPGDRVTVRVSVANLPGDGVPFNGDLTDQDFALVCRNCVPPAPQRRHGSRRLAPVVESPIQVNVDVAGRNITGDAANEPSLAIDPDDPLRMVMAWRQFDSVASDWRTAGWATSSDGGCTWRARGAIDGQAFRTDPVLAALGDGKFAFLGVSENVDAADVFLSGDGGVMWTGPIPAFGGDKPWMTSDPNRDALYLSWSDSPSCCGDLIFSRSLDEGSTFEEPVAVPRTPVYGTVTTGVDGEVYVPGVQNDWYIGVARADAPFDPDRPLSFDTTTVDLGGDFPLGKPPNPGGLATQIWAAADRSEGSYHGSVYLLSAVDPPGPDPLDLMIARSDDRGVTWTPPIQVVPDNDATWQWFPTLSVAPTGRIDVAYVHTPDPEVPEINEIRLTSSWNGGETWSRPRTVSARFDSQVGWPSGQAKIGDYYQLVSVEEGAYLAFAATFNGEQDVYLLRLGMTECRGDSAALVESGAAVSRERLQRVGRGRQVPPREKSSLP